VTHELGQPISAFRNHLAAAEIGQEITSPTTAANLNKLVDRMEAITRQFRFFVRGRTEEKQPVRLSLVLEETVALLAEDIKKAQISLRPGPVSPTIWVHAHQVQLEQVFTNLLKNAIHAVEETDDPEIHMEVSQTANSVEVRISDNGPGLAGASLSELTKPSGVGMGLGLAIATEIIHDHGGSLRLGTVAQGAEFIITLPIEQDGAPT